MSNKIFCYIDDRVGEACLNFLLKYFSMDTYYVVVGKKCTADIYALLKWKQIDFLEEENFREEDFENCSFDWLLSLFGHHIFSENFLRHFKYTLNIHPSYLPWCRGSDSVIWGMQYENPLGATLHVISPKLDCGAIWVREKISYNLASKGGELYEKVIDLCIDLFEKYWKVIRDLKIKPTPHEGSKGKAFTRKETQANRILNGSDVFSVKDLILRVNAHDFSNFEKNSVALVKINGKCYQLTLNMSELNE